MNNSLLAIEAISQEKPEPQEVELDTSPWLRSREGELVTIVEALRSIEESESWSSLKKHVFDGVLENLERRLASEAQKATINEREMYKLQGQIVWAKKYSNLGTLADIFKLELTNIKKKLNGK